MRAAAVVLGSWAAAATTAADLERAPYTHADYVREFGKTYSSSEERAARKSIFEENLGGIRRHNADRTATWKAGVNQFTDWTDEEFRASRTGLRRSPPAATTAMPAAGELPAAVDWRTHTPPVVTPVKNQGSCGSCWAFSTAETVESAVAVATGRLFVLSPQQLVSCAKNPHLCGGTGGCAGSTQPIGFNYTIAAGGLSTDAEYPYQAATGKCDDSKVKPVAGVTGQVDLPANNYTALMHAVASVGPIAVSVAAGSWKSYESGVYSGKHWMIDHAVQLVGYGHDAGVGKDYWIVRNSWGESWGEAGYIRLERFGEGKEPCVTDYVPAGGFGCLKPPGPLTIKVCGTDGVLSGSSYPTGGFVV